MKWKYCPFIILLIAVQNPVAAQSAQGVDRSVDAFLKVFGLEDLNEAQRERAHRMVRALAGSKSSDDILAESARAYFENEGFDVVQMSIVSAGGREYLVVNDRFGKSATKDLPLGLSAYRFKAGPHFAKRQVFKGVSEFIDDDGQVRRLLFADWIDLK